MNTKTIIGLRADQTPIVAHVDNRHHSYTQDITRILLVAPDPLPIAGWCSSPSSGLAASHAVSALIETNSVVSYTPTGDAYAGAPEAHSIWRWMGVFAPDLVIIERKAARDDDLTAQLPRVPAAGVGTIPCVAVDSLTQETLAAALSQQKNQHSAASIDARSELRRRLARTPHEIATMLSARYATALDQAVYIPALALIGRIRLGEMAAVENIVAPYLDGSKQALANLTSSHFAGHLLFGVLAQKTGRRGYIDLVRAAADKAFDEHGQPLAAMPLHDEMSDSLFLVCPLLAQAAQLTGESRYADMCIRHLHFIQHLTRRSDGLYRHSPLSETAWGRGNGFAALGFLFTLEYLSPQHSGYNRLIKDFQSLMQTLLSHQQQDGMWRQVIDLPGSYAELSATCMIATALSRGIKRGWLPSAQHKSSENARFGAALARAWYAICARISHDGELVNVCTGTGKQASLQAYLDRVAILGADLRGGAMALLVATELLGGSAADL